MSNPIDNLKAVIEYFGVNKNKIARAIGVDPSLISRWLSGERKLRAASRQMDALSEYIMSHSKHIQDMEWLQAQFEAAGLPTDISSVYRIKQNLIMWLSTDGEDLRHNLGDVTSAAVSMEQSQKKAWKASNPGCSGIKLGNLDIALELERMLSDSPVKGTVDIFLSNDQIAAMVNEDISGILLHMTEENNLQIRMAVCVSGDTKAMSALIGTYMVALISGHIRLSVIHGMTQTVTNQMHLIIPGTAAMLVTETPGDSAPSVAVIISEPSFLTAIKESFEQTYRFSRPVLNIYSDDFSRNILDIIYQEFCTPGALDVLKDSINPLYMTEDDYNRVLSTHGHSKSEYAWRSAEFRRFKSGMDETLKAGSQCREILSMERLNQIVRDGFCRLPGLYFMKKGFVHLDAEGCDAILNGYIKYLETVPSFNVLILDEITMLHSNNCWQLKQNHHLAINHWSGSEPVMIHSDQLMLLREFQTHFDKIWAQGAGGIGTRTNVISILQDVIKRLREKHLPR